MSFEIACKKGDTNLMTDLISKGLDVNNGLEQCIQLAMDAPVIELQLYSNAINYLLEKGADINKLKEDDLEFLVDENIISEQFIANINPPQKKEEAISSYEEDSEEYNDIISSNESITGNDKQGISVCSNESPVMLMPYEESDYNNILIVYVLNQSNKFETATCITKDELKSFLLSDIDVKDGPTNLMSIYTTPKYAEEFLTGVSGKPTGRIVVRLPQNQIYVTSGSIKRMLINNVKKWYALPLFGGKRRRIGNLRGIFGSSMNHGQVPGFVVYKLYTEEEIKNKVKVEETEDDYPMTFVFDKFKTLLDIFEEKENERIFQNQQGIPIFQLFINAIIKNLIT